MPPARHPADQRRPYVGDEPTLLVAPLVLHDRRLGMFALTFPGERQVDEQTQVDFLTTLAAVTAQALDRALGEPGAAREGDGS